MEHQQMIVKYPTSANLDEFDLTMILASRLYELGKLTSGQAAEMVGVSKSTFIELLGKFGISVFGYSLEDEDMSLL